MSASGRALIDDLSRLISRDLDAVCREIAAYPDDETPWQAVRGMPNSGGTLVLHLAGNLRHFVGAVLGDSGYVRNREAEFADRDVPRGALDALIRLTRHEVQTALAALDPAQLERPYPLAVQEQTLGTRVFLLHLLSHLTYHLGQLDAHRRVASGHAHSINAVALAPLAR